MHCIPIWIVEQVYSLRIRGGIAVAEKDNSLMPGNNIKPVTALALRHSNNSKLMIKGTAMDLSSRIC